MAIWAKITKDFLKETDKNKLIIVLVGCLVASNWYWFENVNNIMKEREKEKAQYYELQALRNSDNLRNVNLVNNLNARIQTILENHIKERKETYRDFERLHNEDKKLYDLVIKKLNE